MQFRDLKTQYQALKPQIDSAIQSVLDCSEFILGSPVAELEEKLADYVGCKHCITCANGTDALQLSLMSIGVGRGDAVFVPDFTFFATAGAASILNAHVVLVDIDEKTFNLSPKSLEEAIKRVRAEAKYMPKVIIPVDLFGLPADYPHIRKIAEQYNLKIIEDAAQGFGGKIGDQRACSFGNLGITSFFPAKPLGCYGDGGAIFTDDSKIAERLYSLRAQGRSKSSKYEHCEIGMNSRLDTIQAAILLEKLKAFEHYELQSVNEAAKWYTECLSETVRTPFVPDGFYSSWAQYTIMLKNTETRDRVQCELKKRGIPSMVYYPFALHQQKPYQGMGRSDAEFPAAMRAVKTVLSLPIHPYIKEEDVYHITQVILKNA